MYSRQQASQLRQEFWTALGRYMSPIPSSEGEKINWINYRTGVKGVSFRMEATESTASIRIELKEEGENVEGSYFDRLTARREKLENAQNGWTWENRPSDGQAMVKRKLETTLQGVNILHKSDWPSLISFFKQHLLILDRFWNSVKYSFPEYT